MHKLLTVIPVALVLIGCATMKNGPEQTIHIETPKMRGASCEVSNNRGSWHVASTPSHIKVARAASPLKVICSRGTATGEVTIKSEFQKNSILGGVSGMSVDVATGSAYNYPTTIKVPMARVR